MPRTNRINKAGRGAYLALWREEHPGYGARWRAANTEKIRGYQIAPATRMKNDENRRRWRRNNPESARAQSRRSSSLRRARMAGTLATLTAQQWEGIILQHCGACLYCGTTEDIQQDHYIPITAGGGHVAGNVVPACGSCNKRKGNKVPIVVAA